MFCYLPVELLIKSLKTLQYLFVKNIMFRIAPEWRVEKAVDYRVYSAEVKEVSGTKATFLIMVDGGYSIESYRICLEGGKVALDFWGQDVAPLAFLKGVRFLIEIESGDVVLSQNSFKSKWINLEDYLESRQIKAFRGKTSEDITVEILKMLKDMKTSHPDRGAAIRWSVQARGCARIVLVLQTLPLSAGKLQKQAWLSGDDVVAVLLGQIPLRAELSQIGSMGGLVPVLFSRDPVDLYRHLQEDPVQLVRSKYKSIPV
jgi:hypothetical protein